MAKKVAVTTDQKTLNLIQEVKRQKNEIAKLEKPNWKTNCSFSYIEGKLDGVTNIHVESNIRKLLLIASFLIGKERDYKEAVSCLGVEGYEFTWEGFSVLSWLEDIKLRIGKIQIASKREKLELLEARLNANISPELKAQMELDAIENELGVRNG